nr:hypothetical protein [Tanacetum cinerariifolium]
MDPRGDIMVLTLPPKRYLIPVSSGPPFTKMPRARSRLHEGTNIFSWPSIICQNGLKRKRSPQMTPESFASSLNLSSPDLVKDKQEKDEIGSKPDKKGKRGEARRSQKWLQSREQEKLKKMKVEGTKLQTPTKY